jgi:hypothetical protein
MFCMDAIVRGGGCGGIEVEIWDGWLWGFLGSYFTGLLGEEE